MSARRYWLGLRCLGVLFSATLLQTGCKFGDAFKYGAGGAIGFGLGGAATDVAIDAIAKVLKGTDKAKTSFTVASGASEELAQAKIVALALDPSALAEEEHIAADTSRIVEAGLSQKLMNMGYLVIGREALGVERSERTPLELARDYKADLLVSGSVSRSVGADAGSRGWLLRKTKIEFETLVNSAVVHVTSCVSGIQIVNGTISYKKGKPAADAAADLAQVLQAARNAGPTAPVPAD